MIAPVELRLQRAQTHAFIKADAREVTLRRSLREPDGAGGFIDGDPVDLPPQCLRLMPRQDGATPRPTADGEMVEPGYTLLGRHDADMRRWDTFVLDGVRYEVVFVNENRQYEVKGEVAYRGGE